MNLAYVSLGALVVAILVSCFTELNVGILAIALAWIVGVYVGGMPLNDVIAGFPVSLFLTLSGVTLLFAQAQQNRTLDRIAHRAVRVCRGNTGLIPIMFFVLGCALASMGPGNISTAALLGPMAMAVAGRAAIPAFLMIIMVGNGAQAGALSPFAPTGVIVNGLMVKIGLPGHEWFTYWTNLVAHAAVAFGGYALFGGLKLFTSSAVVTIEHKAEDIEFDRSNLITIVVIAALLDWRAVFPGQRRHGRVCGRGHPRGGRRRGPQGSDQANAVVGHRDDERRHGAYRADGKNRRARSLHGGARAAGDAGDDYRRHRVRHRIDFGVQQHVGRRAACVSADHSRSHRTAGRRRPLAIAASMNIGAHLVDLSPLSTTGALCIAAVASGENIRSVFNKLLVWGLSMTIVGGVSATSSSDHEDTKSTKTDEIEHGDTGSRRLQLARLRPTARTPEWQYTNSLSPASRRSRSRGSLDARRLQSSRPGVRRVRPLSARAEFTPRDACGSSRSRVPIQRREHLRLAARDASSTSASPRRTVPSPGLTRARIAFVIARARFETLAIALSNFAPAPRSTPWLLYASTRSLRASASCGVIASVMRSSAIASGHRAAGICVSHDASRPRRLFAHRVLRDEHFELANRLVIALQVEQRDAEVISRAHIGAGAV